MLKFVYIAIPKRVLYAIKIIILHIDLILPPLKIGKHATFLLQKPV